MISATQKRFPVRDESFVGVTRRSIRALAESLGLNGEALGRVDIISSELATNLSKHVEGGGEILALDASEEQSPAMHLLSIDRGAGVSDVEKVIMDGFSTAGTMGAGLGAIKRQSDHFDLVSSPGKGTVIHCFVREKSRCSAPKNTCSVIELSGISLPRLGEERCGDGVMSACSEDMTSILVVDGLGHGDGAADAAEKALRVFSATPFVDPSSIATNIHKQLAGTRGAALAIVQIDHVTNQLAFVGVGNITCRIYSKYSSKGCVSVQGIVGEKIGSLKQYTYDWESDARLLMYSDGIKSSAQLCEYMCETAVVAAAEVYRDYCRGNDDATIVVAKDKRRK